MLPRLSARDEDPLRTAGVASRSPPSRRPSNHDELQTLEDTLRYFDVRMRSRGAFSVPVGGSDSHVHVLRATTWVLAQARTEPAIRDAIVAGRV